MNNFTSNLFTWQTGQVRTILLLFLCHSFFSKTSQITTPAVQCITTPSLLRYHKSTTVKQVRGRKTPEGRPYPTDLGQQWKYVCGLHWVAACSAWTDVLQILQDYWAATLVESSWNVMAHGDGREGKWRGNWRMQWVASTLHTTSEHGVSSITTADAHTSAADLTLKSLN